MWLDDDYLGNITQTRGVKQLQIEIYNEVTALMQLSRNT